MAVVQAINKQTAKGKFFAPYHCPLFEFFMRGMCRMLKIFKTTNCMFQPAVPTISTSNGSCSFQRKSHQIFTKFEKRVTAPNSSCSVD